MTESSAGMFIPDPPDLYRQRRVRAERMLKNLKTCVWPLCKEAPDTEQTPLCFPHSMKVSDIYRERAMEFARQRQVAQPKRPVDPVQVARTSGQIYYIRLNDVIKIGWSAQLQGRLADYGAGAVLLAHHPGSRADERDLHRSFKPLRVHGREWYRGDAQIILDHIANMLDEYGPPLLKVERNAKSGQMTGKHWTGHKAG